MTQPPNYPHSKLPLNRIVYPFGIAERHRRRQRHLENRDFGRARERDRLDGEQQTDAGPLPAKLRANHQRKTIAEVGLRAARSVVQPEYTRPERLLECRG